MKRPEMEEFIKVAEMATANNEDFNLTTEEIQALADIYKENGGCELNAAMFELIIKAYHFGFSRGYDLAKIAW